MLWKKNRYEKNSTSIMSLIGKMISPISNLYSEYPVVLYREVIDMIAFEKVNSVPKILMPNKE